MSISSCDGQNQISKMTTHQSRLSCVKIISKQGNSSGTGFFIGPDKIATCFHVVSQIIVDSAKNVQFNIYPDLEAITEDNDTIGLACISIPTKASPEPLFQDFAILKTNSPIDKKSILRLSNDTDLDVGDNIVFSGFPLGTPTMVTHYGTISGVTKDKSIICIQAATNKGNSGGALVDKDGQVIGIVSMREGGISISLQNYLNQITASEKYGGIQLMGIDPLQAAKETIQILDTYISTGIGYARSSRFLQEYINRHRISL